MFLSIVTVVYNGEKTIRKTLESVLHQDFEDYEYIIVDGASTDNTLSVINEYADAFGSHLNVISEKDKGIYDAMNKGILHSSGDFVWLINADDWACPGAFKRIKDYVLENSISDAVICGGMNLIDSVSGAVKFVGLPTAEEYLASCRKLKMGFCHPGTVVARSVYNRVGLYDIRYCISADIDFCLRCFISGADVRFMGEVITNMSTGGVSNQINVARSMNDIRLTYSKYVNPPFIRTLYLFAYRCKLLVLKHIKKS